MGGFCSLQKKIKNLSILEIVYPPFNKRLKYAFGPCKYGMVEFCSLQKKKLLKSILAIYFFKLVSRPTFLLIWCVFAYVTLDDSVWMSRVDFYWN